MASLTCIAQSDRRSSPLAAIALGIAVTVVPRWAFAGTEVRGNQNAVHVEAQDASVEEVLTALTKAFNVHFRSSADLDKRLTGTYEGTLNQVLTRVLGGYNSVVKSGEKGLEVTLLGSAKTLAVIGTPSTLKRVDETAPVSASTTAGSPPVIGSPPVPAIRLADGTPPAPVNGPSALGGPTPRPAQAAPPTAAPPPAGAPLTPGPATAAFPSPMPKNTGPLTPGTGPLAPGTAPSVRGP
jgi:hypothetical protein